MDEEDTSLQSCKHQKAIGWTQIEPMNFIWLQKINTSKIDLNILLYKLGKECKFSNKLYWIHALNAKVRTLQIRLLNCSIVAFIWA